MEQAGLIIGAVGGALGILGTAAGIFFGVALYRRNKRLDTAADRKATADEAGVDMGLRMGIEYIKNGVDDIKLEQLRMRDDFGRLSERVTRIEESTKSAHKRLDALDGRVTATI